MEKKKAKLLPIDDKTKLTEEQMEKVLEALFGKSLVDKIKD
tara:strand:- start:3626 stop:3748 length:123 start_codon:yes stop_codon:yes gene_type:complete